MQIMSEWPPKILFETSASKKSNNKHFLYLSKSECILVDYLEIDEYLKKGYKKLPRDCIDKVLALLDLDESLSGKQEELKDKIDHAENELSRLDDKIKELETKKMGRHKKV